MNYKNEFIIQQLRTKSLTGVVTTLSVFMAAVITNMLLPQLLIKYVYDPTTLVEAPLIFEYLPFMTYGIALAYFVRVMLLNFITEGAAKSYERKLGKYSDCCSDGCCSENCHSDSDDEISDEELRELERIVDEALKPKKKATKRKPAKRAAAKKTSRRKTTRKSK